ncbi:hypothetical protein K2173_028461 [Erythroxylum novogranatense]|uniref:Uncharacterized protein n=1 Tax=Erythroxylum novogranatense TaxID=1862640 RepID=A0AAV8U500_9ROSI|nr:hypothetical protein K2173_028461 [Erythroxylum novogranatense]
MKVSRFWVLCFVVWSALIVFPNLTRSTTTLSTAGVDFSSRTKMADTSRKLKEKGHNRVTESKNNHNVNLEDYNPIDPVPSSKASIKPGPIEHGTPLNPYIPKPSPPAPSHPGNGGIA